MGNSNDNFKNIFNYEDFHVFTQSKGLIFKSINQIKITIWGFDVYINYGYNTEWNKQMMRQIVDYQIRLRNQTNSNILILQEINVIMRELLRVMNDLPIIVYHQVRLFLYDIIHLLFE